MRMFCKGFLLLLAMSAFSFCGCHANKFKSLDEYSQWTSSYYQHPEAGRLLESLDYYLQSPLFENTRTRGPAVYFFSEAYRLHPGLEGSVYELSKKLKNNEQRFFCFTILWLENSEASLNHLRDFVHDAGTDELRDDVESLLYSPPGDPLDSAVTTAGDIDVLWAMFYATGDENFIQKLIFVAGDGDGAQEIKDFLLGSAARDSLVDAGKKQRRVLEVLEQEAKLQPDEPTNFLRQIVREAKAPGQ